LQPLQRLSRVKRPPNIQKKRICLKHKNEKTRDKQFKPLCHKTNTNVSTTTLLKHGVSSVGLSLRILILQPG
jgi:hypothetical protein